jgi:hypothetical protein
MAIGWDDVRGKREWNMKKACGRRVEEQRSDKEGESGVWS